MIATARRLVVVCHVPPMRRRHVKSRSFLSLRSASSQVPIDVSVMHSMVVALIKVRPRSEDELHQALCEYRIARCKQGYVAEGLARSLCCSAVTCLRVFVGVWAAIGGVVACQVAHAARDRRCTTPTASSRTTSSLMTCRQWIWLCRASTRQRCTPCSAGGRTLRSKPPCTTYSATCTTSCTRFVARAARWRTASAVLQEGVQGARPTPRCWRATTAPRRSCGRCVRTATASSSTPWDITRWCWMELVVT